MYKGTCIIENPIWAVVDLEESAGLDSVKPTEEDITVLRQLLDSLRRSVDGETPGAYEKRLTSERIIPKSDAGTRRSILTALAMGGVLPNRLIETS